MSSRTPIIAHLAGDFTKAANLDEVPLVEAGPAHEAPSMSGCAMIPAMLSPFTDPP